MTVQLDALQIETLHELLLAHVAKGEQARHVVDYLISEYGNPDRISPNDISDHGGPHGDGNVAAFMSRLKEAISHFFDYEREGRNQPCRVAFSSEDRGNYAFQAEVNVPPKDLVAAFFRGHFSSCAAIVYAERLSPELFVPEED